MNNFEWTTESENFVDEAAAVAINFIDEAFAIDDNATVLVESKIPLSPYIPQGFGTLDLGIVAGEMIHVLDFKFGLGVQVSPVNNSQGRLYGLGLDGLYGHLYPVKTYRFTVLQPRRNNYATEELSIDALRYWGQNTVMPAAQNAIAGTGPYVPGDHCASGFCRARHTCQARAHYALHVGKSVAYQPPALLSDDQVALVLSHADHIKKWCSDIQDYALKQAIHSGKRWPGFQLTESRASRRYASEEAAAAKLASVGLSEDEIYDRKIIPITRAEQKLGKQKFAVLFDELIVKPRGNLKLVPADDGQPASLSSIELDFR